MKKVAIVLNTLIQGGAEKALVSFLEAFDKNNYDITLFMLNNQQKYCKELQQLVKVNFTEVTSCTCLSYLKKFKIFSAFKVFFFKVMLRLSTDDYKKLSYSIRAYPKFKEKFDCVISYKLNYPDVATSVYRIDAQKRCCIIHTIPYTSYRSAYDRTLSKIDRFYSVSTACKSMFDKSFPDCAKRSYVMHNIINSKEILSKSCQSIKFSPKENSLCTVGRISEEKGQTLIPETVRMLVDSGYDIYWYLVGDGPNRKNVEDLIDKYDVDGRVILLGAQDNPYPYIKTCKIYVQPSFSEGYCTTTMEAKILNKPIVTTDAPGMQEQFVNGENGIIVDGMTSKDLFDGIKTLLDDPALCQKFTDNLSKQTWDNKDELQKIYDFIEN